MGNSANPADRIAQLITYLRQGVPLAQVRLPHGPAGLTAEEVQDHQRWRLIASIACVVSREGYAGTSVNKVCQEVNVSKKSFYEIFPGGLEDCFLAAFDSVSVVISSLTASVDPNQIDDLDQLLSGLLGRYLLLLEQAAELTELLLIHNLGASPAIRQRRVAAFDAYAVLFRQIFDVARERGMPIAAIDDTTMIALLAVINESCIRHIITTGGESGLTSLTPALHRTALRILRAP
ncbi:TetR/AcrR family transcriptional regulator [Nocardia sp. CA-129566]|uniref:TetR/AcrR family transcriptional regulator n=1 Tax=Nocardia sp. CA-129566 TaxID=3239976 RepID=UPI003D984CCF